MSPPKKKNKTICDFFTSKASTSSQNSSDFTANEQVSKNEDN